MCCPLFVSHHRRQQPVMPGPWFPGLVRAESCCKRGSMYAKQISPDKNVNFHYTTAAFTLSPESWASTCCTLKGRPAGLPGDQALYAVSVRRLTVLLSRLPFPLVTLAYGSPFALLKPFGRSLAVPPLFSANTSANP